MPESHRSLPRRLVVRRREKIFGRPKHRQLDCHEKRARIKAARVRSAASRRPGQYIGGPLTALYHRIHWTLLYVFDQRDGCFPSHEAIAERAEASVSTVKRALKELEALGLLDWNHCLKKVRRVSKDLLGAVLTWVPERSSNAYSFPDLGETPEFLPKAQPELGKRKVFIKETAEASKPPSSSLISAARAPLRSGAIFDGVPGIDLRWI